MVRVGKKKSMIFYSATNWRQMEWDPMQSQLNFSEHMQNTLMSPQKDDNIYKILDFFNEGQSVKLSA